MTLSEASRELALRGIAHDIEPQPASCVWRYLVHAAKAGQKTLDDCGPGTSRNICFYAQTPESIVSEVLLRRQELERPFLLTAA